MKNAKHFDTLLRPKVSEKTFALQEQGKYVFVVHPSATKPQIEAAVQGVYGVKVLSVNVINRRGKTTRFRGTRGKRHDTKLAIVTVDSPLDVFGN